MERLTRDEYLMEAAHLVARRGTCSRAQVGVVFAREGRVVATGYNGAPPGVDHCVHESYTYRFGGDDPIPKWMEPVAWSPDFNLQETTYYFDGETISTDSRCTVVSHAERNGISFAAREGIALRDTDVFCTHAPCVDCARSMLGAGIRTLTFQVPYRLTAGVELLIAAGIPVVDLIAGV